MPKSTEINYDKRVTDIASRLDMDIDDAKELVHGLAKYDPTKSKKYLTFIVGVYRKDTTIKFPEDGGRVLQTLTGFDALRNKKKWAHNPDILKYQNKFRELEKLVIDDLEVYGIVSYRSMKHRIQSGKKVDGTEWVFDDRKIFKKSPIYTSKPKDDAEEWLNKVAMFKVLRIDDPKPATYLAQGTSLCTCDLEVAKDYLAHGPLYMVFKNGRPWVQFTHNFSQFMNTADEILSVVSPRTDLFLGMMERSIAVDDDALVNIAKIRIRMDVPQENRVPILAKEKGLL